MVAHCRPRNMGAGAGGGDALTIAPHPFRAGAASAASENLNWIDPRGAPRWSRRGDRSDGCQRCHHHKCGQAESTVLMPMPTPIVTMDSSVTPGDRRNTRAA